MQVPSYTPFRVETIEHADGAPTYEIRYHYAEFTEKVTERGTEEEAVTLKDMLNQSFSFGYMRGREAAGHHIMSVLGFSLRK